MLKIRNELPEQKTKISKTEATTEHENRENLLVEREEPENDENLLVKREEPENSEDLANDIIEDEPSNSEEVEEEMVATYFNQELERYNLQNQIENQHAFEYIFDQEDNYKQNYYKQKFNVNKNNYSQFTNIIKKFYIEGLVWNFNYYYRGCVSWDWFYPFYYAPLLSDMYNFSHYDFSFKPSAPLRPIEQLMAVLPPYSAHALPDAFKPLMLTDDSEIIDFYPIDFDVDVKGKRFAWLGEVILPFIDGDRLRRAISKLESSLTDEERQRNQNGYIVIFTQNEKNSEALPVGLKDDVSEKEVLTMDEFKVERHSIDQVKFYRYSMPEYKEHLCMPLGGTFMPKNDFYYTVT